MNSKKRKWRILFVVCMLISIFTNCGVKAANEEVGDAFANEFSLKVKEPEGGYFADDFVNDFGEILFPDTRSELTETANNFYEETGGISIVITTLPSLPDGLVEWSEENFDPTTITIEELATIMYNQYGIGKHSMGLLILLSLEEGDIRIESGINMEGYLPDSICNRIVEEYGMPYFYEGEFDKGMISLQSAFISEIQKRVPKDWMEEYSTEEINNNTVNAQEKVTSKEKENFFGGPIKMVVIILLLAVIAILVVAYYKLKKNAEETLNAEKRRLVDLYKREMNQLKEKVDNMQEKLNEATLEKNKLDSANNALAMSLKDINEKYSRALSLHPDLENEISNMIEQEFRNHAFEVDKKIKPCFNLMADKDNIDAFERAIKLYEATQSDVKKYLTSDIEKLQSLYDESKTLLREFEIAEQRRIDEQIARKTFEEIVSIYSQHPTGTHLNYKYLNSAYQKYEDLTQRQKRMIPNQDTIVDLSMEVERAKEDYENYIAAKEAEKKVRRIVNGISLADESDLDSLAEVYKYYVKLTPNQREYFDISLYRKLMNFKRDAEDDYERKTEMRRRRRESDMYRTPIHPSMPPHHEPSRRPPYNSGGDFSHSSSSKRPSSTMSKKPASVSRPKSTSSPKPTSKPKSTPKPRDNGRASGGGVTKNFKKK